MERKCPHKDEGFFYFDSPVSRTLPFSMFDKHIILSIFFFFSLSANVFSQESLKELEENLAKARDENNYADLASTYLAIGEYNEENLKNHEKAFESYTRAMDYLKLVSDSNAYHLTKLKVANHFRLTGQRQQALDNYNEIIHYFKRTNQDKNLAKAYLDVSILHANNNNLEPQGLYLDSIQRFSFIKSDTLFNVLFNFEKIRYYKSISDYGEARRLCQETFELSEYLESDLYKGKALFYLGTLISDNRPKEALTHFQDGYSFVKKRALEPIKLDLLKELSEAHSKAKEYDQAFYYSKEYSKLNDSILDRERAEAINNLTVKYEAREKEREIVVLEQQTELVKDVNDQQRRALYVLGGGMFLLAITTYFIVQFFRQRIKATRIINSQRDKINNQKIKDLENDVKINSMQSVIEGQELERKRIAQDLHDSLGGLLSAIKLQFEKVKSDANIDGEDFNNAQDLLDTAVDEVRSISRNLQPGSLSDMGLVAAINDLVNRYVGGAYPDIDFQHYNIPRNLDNMFATSIYRIIQELLNNAIKYANANEIIIQLNREEDEIIISFEDDGVGFNTSSFEKGMGLENVQSRIKYLKGDLQIDSQENIGTSYLIHLKMENAKPPASK